MPKIKQPAKTSKTIKVIINQRTARPETGKAASRVKVTLASGKWGKKKVSAKVTAPPVLEARAYISGWEYAAWFGGLMLVVMLLGTVMVVSRNNHPAANVDSNINKIKEPSALLPPQSADLSPLTGEPVTQEVATRRPLAVMIENFPTVRPQSGLSFADIVWEAPTEGGVTRFLAVFQKGLPSRLGPVRSARPYFIDWAREFGALYAHSGGSDDALDELARGVSDLQDVNEFSNGVAFWRDNKELRPHNLYTDAEQFYSYAAGQKWRITINENLSDFVSNDLAALLAAGQPVAAQEIVVPYWPLDYDVAWRYDKAGQVYIRFMDGQEHLDRSTGGALEAKNVLVMFTDVVPIPRDPLLLVTIKTVGAGPVSLFTNGYVYQGRWQRRSLGSRTEFVDNQGNPLPLQPGNSWISVLDKSQEGELEIK